MNDQYVAASNWTDDDGMPAGGEVHGEGLLIRWQNAPLGRDDMRAEPNGAFVETVIRAAQQRLEWFQTTGFSCPENAEALGHLGAALEALADRTRAREARQVEGTHTP